MMFCFVKISVSAMFFIYIVQLYELSILPYKNKQFGLLFDTNLNIIAFKKLK